MSSTEQNELQRSLASIVVSLQSELDELLLHKARIKLRMRTLRRRLGVLQAGSDRNAASRRWPKKAKSMQAREMSRSQEKLWRACRIAFLDLGGTATAEELYSAIARRGSFSFAATGNNGVTAIVRTLSALVQLGEVSCSINDSDQKWTYRAGGRILSL